MPNWKTYESSVRLLSAIIAAHPNLKLDYGEIARFYGDDSAYKSVWDRMNTMSKHAKNLVAAVEAGQDPFTVPLVDSKGNSRAKAIASNYGEGASENGGTPTKAKKPRAKATPKKKAKKGEASGDDEDREGGSDVEMQSPTKGPLNKTLGGRVAKQQRTPRKTAPINLTEAASEEEDEEGDMIKNEHNGYSQAYSHGGSFNNGNGYGNGHGNGNGYTAEGYGDSFENGDDGDMYYAAEDGYGGGDDEVV